MAKLIRFSDSNLEKDVHKLAEEQNKSENAFIEDAVRYYRDYLYMKDRATIINDEIMRVIKASLELLEQRINHKTNSVLSELAIQGNIMAQIIADSLEIDPTVLPEYRRKAVEFLKANNRVLRLDELI